MSGQSGHHFGHLSREGPSAKRYNVSVGLTEVGAIAGCFVDDYFRSQGHTPGRRVPDTDQRPRP